MKINKLLENMRNILKGETHFIFLKYTNIQYIFICVLKLVFFLIIKKKNNKELY